MLYGIAATLSLTAGLILFGLGVVGVTEIPHADMHPVTVLLYPLGLSETMDSIYYSFLMFLGFWLTLCIHIRVPAGIALALVLAKVTYLGDIERIGVLPALALLITLGALLIRMLTTRTWLRRDAAKDIGESLW